MARSYLPSLIKILHKACTYIVRYRLVLNTFLDETQRGYLDAVVVACETFTASVTIEIGQ